MSAGAAKTHTYESFQDAGYFGALDGLRGFAILLVLLHHVPEAHPAVPFALAENGRYGVSLFFAISGFLICSLLLREKRQVGRIDLPRFYGRRALRLLPLYYVVLAAQAVLVFGLHQYSPENIALFKEKLGSYLFYYSNWLPTATQGPFFCAWSLAVEEQFYLVFAVLLVAVPLRYIAPLAFAALAVKCAVYFAYGQVDAVSTPLRVLFSYQEPILWGVLLALACNHPRVFPVLRACLGHPLALPALALATTAWLLFHPMTTGNTPDAQLLYFLIALLVGALVLRRRVAFLASGPLAHIGRVSYGIYLLHMFFVSAVKKIPGLSGVACLLISTAAVIVAASLVHRYFETPIIQFYKRRFNPLAATKTPASPATASPGTVVP